MCMDMMGVVRKLEKQRQCSCRRLRYTKWRLRKCLVDEGDKLWMKWKADAVKATARKFRPRSLSRKATSKRVYWQRFVVRCQKDRSIERPVELEGRGEFLPTGSMAPENRSQYLMNIVFQDLVTDCGADIFSASHLHGAIDLTMKKEISQLYGEASSPQSVYALLDCTYETTMQFQQRDFENMFQRYNA